MHSVWFGEFMGTLVLVLLGDGVCAGVTLRKSYAADCGLDGDHDRVGAGRVVRRDGGAGVRQSGRHINPAITLAAAVSSGNYALLAGLLVGADCWARCAARH